MSDASDDDEKVGYGRPPKAGQFRKGKSGNPRGRPKKTVAEKPELIEAHHPTREALRFEGKRLITVTDASGRHQIPSVQAVVRALENNAMRGGVVAQRTVLALHMAEDERLHRERMERCKLWDKYRERERATIKAALAAGKPEPELVPHPDDIEINWRTLEVRFLGAIDEETRAAEKLLMKAQSLAFEMSIYTEEDGRMPTETDKEGRIGGYMALHVYLRGFLSPRLQGQLPSDETIRSWVFRDRKAWGDELELRCQEVGLPFVRWHRKLTMKTASPSKLGLIPRN